MSIVVQTPELAKTAVANAPTAPPTISEKPPANPPKPVWRVLLVSTDSAWLIQTENELAKIEPTWSCQHAGSSLNALDILSVLSFNALVMDGTLPDGVQLLKTLSREISRTVCLVRCCLKDRDAVARWDRSGATPVAKECDTTTLAESVKRAARLREWMSAPAIKGILPKIHKLPASPKLHAQVTKELKSTEGSMQVVGGFISQDPIMAAKLLQVANSAFFGLTEQVSNPTEAVMVLGTERIRGLILLAGIFSQYEGAKCPGFSPEPIWGHSLQVGVYAQAITMAQTKNAALADAAFTAGLLHDVGKLILVGNLPDTYEAIRRLQAENQVSPREAEIKIMGTTHSELGACLLATWGLPLPILEAIALHHQPELSADTEFSVLAAVHAANIFAKGSASTNDPSALQDRVNKDYLARIGLGDCINQWRAFCGLPPQADTMTSDERQRLRREVKEN